MTSKVQSVCWDDWLFDIVDIVVTSVTWKDCIFEVDVCVSEGGGGHWRVLLIIILNCKYCTVFVFQSSLSLSHPGGWNCAWLFCQLIYRFCYQESPILYLDDVDNCKVVVVVLKSGHLIESRCFFLTAYINYFEKIAHSWFLTSIV